MEELDQARNLLQEAASRVRDMQVMEKEREKLGQERGEVEMEKRIRIQV